ncbi:MAG: glycosyltransferase family 4 protein [Asticcacaulis sp.]|uniref:glycosyltransferase family 4 protein n=1 Tax=Asticcacaulis sp. TaxID=1872648 RepID=UPI003F7C766F
MLKLEGEPLHSELNLRRVPEKTLRVVGHPFAPIGMGEHVRSLWRSLNEVGVNCVMVDVHGPWDEPDPMLISEFEGNTTSDLGTGINIFCINGDEIEPVLKKLKPRNAFARGSYNIIYPAWELETFPDVWARQVERFNEAWGESRFVSESLAEAVNIPVTHLPLATEVRRRGLFSRRYFGMNESAYTFFFAFDFLSFLERKNPMAVIAAFAKLLEKRPFANVRLVIKTNNANSNPVLKAAFDKAISPIRTHVQQIDRTLSHLEMKALTWQCDAFVSLHRSEGYGFGIAEAMCLGKPVICTDYSGNMDFCTPETTLLVRHRVKRLAEGDYPHWHGQHWADADINVAARYMLALVDDPQKGVDIGRRAKRHMTANFSHLASGLRYTRRLDELISQPEPNAKTVTPVASRSS